MPVVQLPAMANPPLEIKDRCGGQKRIYLSLQNPGTKLVNPPTTLQEYADDTYRKQSYSLRGMFYRTTGADTYKDSIVEFNINHTDLHEHGEAFERLATETNELLARYRTLLMHTRACDDAECDLNSLDTDTNEVDKALRLQQTLLLLQQIDTLILELMENWRQAWIQYLNSDTDPEHSADYKGMLIALPHRYIINESDQLIHQTPIKHNFGVEINWHSESLTLKMKLVDSLMTKVREALGLQRSKAEALV